MLKPRAHVPPLSHRNLRQVIQQRKQRGLQRGSTRGRGEDLRGRLHVAGGAQVVGAGVHEILRFHTPDLDVKLEAHDPIAHENGLFIARLAARQMLGARRQRFAQWPGQRPSVDGRCR